MGAVGLNVTDTFYAKNNPIYLNLENLLSDEIPGFNAVRLRVSEFGNYSLAEASMPSV